MNEDLQLRLPDGRRLAYAEYGDPNGVVVLGLHGTPGTRHLFALADAAARTRGLRLIAPDRAGIGGSDDCPGHGVAGHVEDLAALLDHLGAETFALLGFSGGSPYAAEAAARLGARIRSVALVSPYAIGRPTGPGQWVLLRLARISTRLARWMCVLIAAVAVQMPLFSRAIMSFGVSEDDRRILKDPEVRRRLVQGMAGVLWQGRGTAREVRNFSYGRLPASIALDAPVHIWHGTDDLVVAPEAALCYARMFPNAHLNLIPGAGHYWGLVESEQVLQTLAEDLR